MINWLVSAKEIQRYADKTGCDQNTAHLTHLKRVIFDRDFTKNIAASLALQSRHGWQK